MAKGKIILVLGGIRSGKSKFALQLAKGLSSKQKVCSRVTFVATCNPNTDDPEMQDRIKKHKQARPKDWQTIEESDDPLPLILKTKPEVVLLDCLSLHISNLLISGQDESLIIKRIRDLVEGIKEAGITGIVVANEVGHSLVPLHKLGRQFADLTGQANQMVAEGAEEVYLSVAGIPLKIK